MHHRVAALRFFLRFGLAILHKKKEALNNQVPPLFEFSLFLLSLSQRVCRAEAHKEQGPASQRRRVVIAVQTVTETDEADGEGVPVIPAAIPVGRGIPVAMLTCGTVLEESAALGEHTRGEDE